LAPVQERTVTDPRLLVGTQTSDDAGVYLLDENTALVQTIDIITPVVDDPYDYGFIAAVNSLSDIYAMGGRPLTALSFLAFDPCDLPDEAASEILTGALAALGEAGCTLVGGHTLEEPEIKFGLAVTGTVHPDNVVTNAGARDGDIIYLTKPLGTGIASTALKGEMIPDELLKETTGWMKTMNSDAAAAMVEAGATAATDVTGFGLLGHLAEMCRGADLGVELNLGSIPLMSNIIEMVNSGMVPEGAYNNIKHLEDMVIASRVSDDSLIPLYDPQTSGGLLISTEPGRAESLEKSLNSRRVFFSRIGKFTGKSKTIRVMD
jgi:selenide,water dikinase